MELAVPESLDPVLSPSCWLVVDVGSSGSGLAGGWLGGFGWFGWLVLSKLFGLFGSSDEVEKKTGFEVGGGGRVSSLSEAGFEGLGEFVFDFRPPLPRRPFFFGIFTDFWAFRQA